MQKYWFLRKFVQKINGNMGRQIIKQPNGKYCVYSSIVDDVIYYDASREMLINQFTQDAKEGIAKQVNEVCDEIESGGKPYLQFTIDFDRLIKIIELHHGKKRAEEVNETLTKI